MTPESAFTFFIAVLIFAVTPGPGLFALIARALASGATACLPLAFGMTLGDAMYLIFACYGLATIAENWSGAFLAIQYIGAAYLLFLGWKMWTAPADLDTEALIKNPKKNSLVLLLQGFLISSSNPKVILFYIAFLPTFMDLTALTTNDINLAVVLTIAALMLGLMTVCYFAAKARKFVQSEVAQKRMNRGAGSVMMAAGVFLLARG